MKMFRKCPCDRVENLEKDIKELREKVIEIIHELENAGIINVDFSFILPFPTIYGDASEYVKIRSLPVQFKKLMDHLGLKIEYKSEYIIEKIKLEGK